MFGSLLKVPRLVFTGIDDRVHQQLHKTHQHERACGGSEVWRDGADQEDEYDEEVICGQCDKPLVKVATDPRMPTERDQ